MQTKIAMQITKLAAKILASWKTADQQQYPGGIWHAPLNSWHEGYGVPRDNELPDFIKKDNEGWDYVAQYKGD